MPHISRKHLKKTRSFYQGQHKVEKTFFFFNSIFYHFFLKKTCFSKPKFVTMVIPLEKKHFGSTTIEEKQNISVFKKIE